MRKPGFRDPRKIWQLVLPVLIVHHAGLLVLSKSIDEYQKERIDHGFFPESSYLSHKRMRRMKL